MSVAEKKTKSNLIEWIAQLSDDNMLSLLDGLRTSKADKDWWDDLSESQKQHIGKGLSDIEDGHTMPANIFWERLHSR